MTDALIQCPNCGHEFPLTEALSAQLRAGIDAEHEADLRAAIAEAEKKGKESAAASEAALKKLLDGQAEAREIEFARRASANLLPALAEPAVLIHLVGGTATISEDGLPFPPVLFPWL